AGRGSPADPDQLLTRELQDEGADTLDDPMLGDVDLVGGHTQRSADFRGWAPLDRVGQKSRVGVGGELGAHDLGAVKEMGHRPLPLPGLPGVAGVLLAGQHVGVGADFAALAELVDDLVLGDGPEPALETSLVPVLADPLEYGGGAL